MSEVAVFYFGCKGGIPISNAVLAPKVARLGVAGGPGGVAKKIADSSKDFMGLSCLAKVIIENRQVEVEIQPRTSALVLKALKKPYVARKKGEHRVHSGNLTLTQITDIARSIQERSFAKTLTGCVLEVLGTANSIGLTVEGVSPKELQQQIKNGEIAISE